MTENQFNKMWWWCVVDNHINNVLRNFDCLEHNLVKYIYPVRPSQRSIFDR